MLKIKRRRRRNTIKDIHAEIALFRQRCLIAGIFIVLLSALLIGRLIYLQIYQYDVFSLRSDNNRLRIIPIPPTRGLIYDRNGILIADNRPTFNLMLTPELTGNVKKTVTLLTEILDLPAEMAETLQERSHQRQRPFQPALLLSDLTEDQIARLALNRYRLPGVDVEAQLLRYYPEGELFAHVLGYVGRISPEDLQRLDPTNYANTHFVGKTGIERFYETPLHGQVGFKRVETNARGQILGEIDRKLPVKGTDIAITIDSGLQRLGMQLLNGRRGAVVAIAPRSGEILAMVSSPSFDANLFVTGISYQDYQKLRDDPDLPLYSRAYRGEYPPASTVKPFMALAGLQNNAVTPQVTIFDPGYYQLPNDSHRYRNWFRWGHGRVNLFKALVVSNDTYFFNLAHLLGISRIAEFMRKFGYGEDTALDVWGARSGLMPDPTWKRSRYNRVWYPGETLSVGIGQGYWLVTPLQMATAVSVLANHGQWVKPHLLASLGQQPLKLPLPDTPPNVALNDPQWWDLVINALQQVANNSAVLSAGRNYTMAAKTGTAQVFTVAQDKRYNVSQVAERLRDHALFVAFAPIEDPQIVVAVIVENAGWGAQQAAPIGKAMIDAWMHSLPHHESYIPGQSPYPEQITPPITGISP